MPEGPLGMPRPFANDKQKIRLVMDEPRDLGEIILAEIQARVNEITPEETQARIAGTRVDAVQRNSNPVQASQIFVLHTNRVEIWEKELKKIIDICEDVFDEAFIDERTPEIRTWSVGTK